MCLKQAFGDAKNSSQLKTAVNIDKKYPELRRPLAQRSSQLKRWVFSTQAIRDFAQEFLYFRDDLFVLAQGFQYFRVGLFFFVR